MNNKGTFLDFETFRKRYPEAKIYVFDVDHTLTRRATAIRLVLNGLRRGYIRLRTVLSIPFHYFNYIRGSYASGDIPNFFKDLRGLTKDFLFLWGHEVFYQTIVKDIFVHAEQFILSCHNAGIPVILSSSTFDFIVDPLARFLKVDTCFSTTVEYVDGVCTGVLSGTANFAKGKVQRIRDEVTRRGFEMKDVAFFSDSINDLPLLEAVGFAVPTHPDPRLQRISQERRWTIWTFSNKTAKKTLKARVTVPSV